MRRKPNILLITMDTVRGDRLGCYGYSAISTPNLDQLSREGVLFEEAFAVQPVTLPAHASILTGKYPFRHGVRDNSIYRLSDEHETLAEVLDRNGYITTAFVASYILDGRFGLNRGFRYYNDRFVKPAQTGRLPVDRRAQEVSFLAVEWLDTLRHELETSPFFLWLHYYDPHAEYNPPHPWKTAYANLYDGEIAYMDDWIGYVFEALRQRNLWDDTMVIAIGDHGEGLGEHGENTHGMFIYRSTIHVPFLMKFPDGQHRETRVPWRVSQVDLVPTVYEWLNLKGRDEIDGRSLMPLITGTETGHRDAYSEVYIPRIFQWSELKGLRRGDGFYIDAPNPEYYDLRSDPKERHNLLDSQPVAAADLRNAMTQLIESAPVPETNMMMLSDDMIKQLEALGYFVSSTLPHEDSSRRLPDPKDRIHVFNAQQRANQLLDRNRIDEAITIYERIANEDPTNPRLLLDLARALDTAGDPTSAEQRYRQAIELDPENGRVLSLLGDLLRRQGRMEDARRHFELALNLNERDFLSLFYLALVHIRKQDYPAARTLLERARSLNPTPSVLNNLGYVMIVGEDRFEEGIDSIRRAVQLSRDPFPYLLSLGSALLRKGHPERAREPLEKALAQRSDSVEAVSLLEQVYTATGDQERLKALHQRRRLLEKTNEY